MAARTVNYTGGEKSLLVDLVQRYRLFVENKRTDACTTKVIVPVTLNVESAELTGPSKTAGRRRPPQDTISSNILSTTKVQAAVNREMNQCKAITSPISISILIYLTSRNLHFKSVPLPRDSAAGDRRPVALMWPS